MIMDATAFNALIDANCQAVAPIMSYPLSAPTTVVVDLSLANPAWDDLDISDTAKLNELVASLIAEGGGQIGIGGYAEDRVWYQRAELFDAGSEARTIHLGVDIWAPVGTEIFLPIHGRIHSFKNNAKFGDYGPTVIVEHELEGNIFYTLYGHLDRSSLDAKKQGQNLASGALIGRIGSAAENGNWPTHLHFQVILDMLGYEGDFPGVACRSKKDYFMTLCPDPKSLLKSA